MPPGSKEPRCRFRRRLPDCDFLGHVFSPFLVHPRASGARSQGQAVLFAGPKKERETSLHRFVSWGNRKPGGVPDPREQGPSGKEWPRKSWEGEGRRKRDSEGQVEAV